MIINIRGTHGSGKSTIIQTLLKTYKAQPESFIQLKSGKRKVRGYVMHIFRKKVFVVGSYETACGGCDGIQPYSLIWPLVEEYASQGSVLFEGALVSSSYGNIGRASESYGENFVFAFLDTPLSLCLDRIIQRRKSKGNDKPLNPKNTTDKYNYIQSTISTIQNDKNRRVVILNHKKPLPQLLKLLK